MKHFTELTAWQVGLELVSEVYAITKYFPPDERFELVKQLRKSSESILANIAEGFGRFTYPDKTNKYTIARGECYEVEAHLLVAIHLKFVTQLQCKRALELVQRERRLLSGLITACRKH